jgi:hypothetical protein
VERYKGVARLRQATDGVFNVKINKTIEAMADKMRPRCAARWTRPVPSD